MRRRKAMLRAARNYLLQGMSELADFRSVVINEGDELPEAHNGLLLIVYPEGWDEDEPQEWTKDTTTEEPAKATAPIEEESSEEGIDDILALLD